MNKIKGEILNYRIFLKVSFLWVFGSPFWVTAWLCSAKWAQIGCGLAWNKGRVRIALNMILIWCFSNESMVLWHQVSVPSFLEDLFEELIAAMQSWQQSSCVPPWVCNVLCPKRLVSLQQFTQSDLIIDWEKSRSCCFPMRNSPNSVCFIKKIAGISLMAKKGSMTVTGLCWGCPGCSPQCDRGITPTRSNGKWFCYIHSPQVPQLNPGEIQSL